jgi:ribulose-bisphosphate carboxylase large chain
MANENQRAEFRARYLVESPEPLQKVAEVIAGEQSSGTFLALAGETDELKRRSRARVTRLDPLPPAHEPSLRSAWVDRRGRAAVYQRGEVEIAFPIDNVGANLSTLLATAAGNLFELGEVTALRLLDLDLPAGYAGQFPGPQFGVPGTRQKAGVYGRPLIGTIIKPSIGLTPEQTAELVDSLCAADIDFIKDDELMADPPYAPFAQRLAAVMPVLRRHAERIGRMPMYAINISGSIDEMLRRHDEVVRAGGTCVMVSVNWVGLPAVEHLRRHAQVPIHGHRNGWGALTRCPNLGIDFAAYQKIWRLAGVDQLHVNGLRSKFWEADDSVIASAQACLAPFGGSAPIMPVFSSGQWAGQAPEMFARLRTVDLMHLAGGGIIGHPQGTAAGVASMREGWEAAVAGVPLADYARQRPALAAAMAKFGEAA